MLIMLPVIFMMNKIDLKEPDTLNLVRIGYFTSQAIVLLTCFIVFWIIRARRDRKEFEAETPAKPFSTEPPTKYKTTVYDYDLAELQKQTQNILVGLLITSFIHFKFGVPHPLFIQSFMTPVTCFTSNLVKIHILGQKGPKLVRPWKEEKTGLSAMFAPKAEEPAPAAVTDANESVSDKEESSDDKKKGKKSKEGDEGASASSSSSKKGSKKTQ